MIYFLFLLPSFLFSVSTWEGTEGPAHAKVTLSHDKLMSGEDFRIFLEIRYPVDHRIDTEELLEELGQSITLISENIQRIDSDDEAVTRIEYLLTPWMPGYYDIAFLPIRVYPLEGPPITLYSQVFELRVLPPKEEPTGEAGPQGLLPLRDQTGLALTPENRQEFLDDAKRQEEAKKRNRDIFEDRSFPWHLLFWIVALSATAYLLQKLRCWRSKDIELQKLAPKEKALQALHKLFNEDLPSRGLFERYFVELSLILRRFIEEEHGIQAPEQTTEEFLQDLSHSQRFSPDTQGLLSEFMFQADMVKFARYQSSSSECQNAGLSAKKFIQS